MISYLKGEVVLLAETYAVVNVQGVGYKVFMTGTGLSGLILGKEIELWTHLAVRETALDLYGFPTREELEFFELLITVSGIGPKTALGILNVASIALLRQAIFSENAGPLTKISGIGKKNADKIVLELRGKLSGTAESFGAVPEDEDAIDALEALGYSQKEAREALKEVPSDVTNTGERVKKALKLLGKQ